MNPENHYGCVLEQWQKEIKEKRLESDDDDESHSCCSYSGRFKWTHHGSNYQPDNWPPQELFTVEEAIRARQKAISLRGQEIMSAWYSDVI